MKDKILGIFIIVIFTILLFLCGMNSKVTSDPIEAYQVYLNGTKIGLIKSKDDLYDMIDQEQDEIKNKYNVDKVYPPHGLEIKKVYTYDNKIVDTAIVYNQIKDKDPFTIEGYKVTIKYNSDKVADEEADESEVTRDSINIYLMDKELIYEGLYNTAAAFISTEDLEDYENQTQTEIDDVGEIITSVYFDETITVKKDYISVEEYIFDNVDELSQYLLFGTLDEQESYTIQEGEDLNTIAYNHQLNVEELLIANPNYPSANVLLAAGDTLNVGLIDPLVTVVYKKTLVEDVAVAYEEETEKDNTKSTSYRVVKTEGKDGVSRVTQDVTYINGEVKTLDIVKQEVLVAAQNEVVVVGTKAATGTIDYNPATSSEWSWPTTIPFKIVSTYTYRWGRMHQGIDICTNGIGSAVYAVGDGEVYHINMDSSKNEGISIRIDHGNGYTTIYMHLSKVLVKEGQKVSKHDLIGLMGCTGRCYGAHLHLGVYLGHPYEGGVSVDPCKTIFSC
jgi:murein DD-endopeptidase MepM/ murein hydrolase activator NlpD